MREDTPQAAEASPAGLSTAPIPAQIRIGRGQEERVMAAAEQADRPPAARQPSRVAARQQTVMIPHDTRTAW